MKKIKINKIIEKSKKSIKTRTIYIITLILSISVGLWLTFNIFSIRNTIISSMENELYASGLLIRKSIKTNLNYFKLDAFSGMKSFLKGIIKSNDKISYCFISDRKRKVLYHSKNNSTGYLLDKNIYTQKILLSSKAFIKVSNYREMILPILYNDSIIGHIHIGVKNILISTKIINNVIGSIFIFLISLIFTIYLLSYLLAKKVLTPISKLSNNMKKITKEMDFTKQIEILGKDEISELGKTFNLMIKEIKKYSENLEEIVVERTEQLNLANKQLERKNFAMEKELKMAAILQNSILPKAIPAVDGLNIEAYYISMEHIGGDYYDIFHLDDDKLGILIADVSGHGVPAALVTMMAKVAFSAIIKEGITTDIILERVNKELSRILGGEVMHYVTAFYLTFDYKHNFLQYSTAGHPNQIHYIKDKDEIQYLKTYGRFLGIREDSSFGRGECFVNEGDKLILFTDGIVEARNKKNELYKFEGLIDYIKKNSGLNAENFISGLINDVKNFCQDMPQSDDMAVIVIDILKNKKRGQIEDKFKNKEKEIRHLKKTADKFYSNKEYIKAANLLIQAMFKEGKNNNETILKIADCYYYEEDLENTVKYLELAVSLDPHDVELRGKYYRLYDQLNDLKN